MQALAYHSSLYSRAQAMRRDGRTPSNMGAADELPARLAAQQLNVLAGMSQKVSSAVMGMCAVNVKSHGHVCSEC